MTVLDVNPVVEEAAEPALSVSLTGDDGSIKGWVIVDSLVDGWAMGGTRMTESVTEAEVRGLARGMTEKLTLVGLPIGGAKAGIVADRSNTRRTLEAFGRTVAPLLHGGIHLGCDLGVTPADRAVFFGAAGYDPRKRPRAVPMPYDWRTYYEPLVDCTGHGVGVAAVTALEALHYKDPVRVVIQGFGTVGRAVGQFLEQRGHHIVGVADELGTVSAEHLRIADLLAVTDSLGRIDRARLPQGVAVSAEPDGWLDVDADILVLAAQKDAVNIGNVHRLTADVVVEGGNLCSSADAKLKLRGSGITLIPDVVANVGGAAAAGLALTGTVPFELPAAPRKEWVFDWVGSRVRNNTRDLLEIATGNASDPLPELLAARRTVPW
jgi:glutamate dehydrogenase (NAD(P)+)